MIIRIYNIIISKFKKPYRRTKYITAEVQMELFKYKIEGILKQGG